MDPKSFRDNSVLDKENNRVFHKNLEEIISLCNMIGECFYRILVDLM
jgi:hypothetical protein